MLARSYDRLDHLYLRDVWRQLTHRDPAWIAIRVVGAGLALAGLVSLPFVGATGLAGTAVGLGFEALYWHTRAQWLRGHLTAQLAGFPQWVWFTEDRIEARSPAGAVWAGYGAARVRGSLVEVPGPEGDAWFVRLDRLDPDTRAIALALIAQQAGGDAVGERASSADDRSLMLLVHAARIGPAGPEQLLFAILSDPQQVQALEHEGIDVAQLEAAIRLASIDDDASWAFLFLDWLFEARDEPLTMAHMVEFARALPALTSVWTAAEAHEQLPVVHATATEHLVIENDEETTFDFVVDQLRAHAGLDGMEAARVVIRAHDEGHADVPVPDPEATARKIRHAAHLLGHPLQVYPRA